MRHFPIWTGRKTVSYTHLDVYKRQALDYFKEIENIENKYLEQKLLKISAMDKYYHQINKNNINKDEKLSTKERCV